MASHLEESMGDVELYGWERVRAYHRVWLNQLEQGRATWEDEEEKVRFPCACTHLAPGHFSFITSLHFSGIRCQEAALASLHLQCTSQAQHRCLQGLQPGQLYQWSSPCWPTPCVYPLLGHGQLDLPTPGEILQEEEIVFSLKNNYQESASPDHPMDSVWDMISSSALVVPASMVGGLRWGSLLWPSTAII